MSSLIRCKHPRIIKHPNLAEWLLDGFDTILYPNGLTKKIPDDKKYYALLEREWYVPELNIIMYYELEREYQSRQYSNLNLSPIVEKHKDIPLEYKHLYNPVYTITQEEALQFSILNEVTGEIRELFLVVPCSHCVLCIDNKKNKLSSRFILESLEHDNPPMFVRLSFDQQHYPKNVDDLQQHTRPIQLFHKRLRRYMERIGMNTDFKYFVTSEYGGERGRLHYHALYFGLHNLNYVPIPNKFEDKKRLPFIYRFTDIIRKCWQNGFVEVEIARDVSGMYALKYMQKDYEHKTKQLKSINMGKNAVMRQASYLRQFPDVTQFKIMLRDGTYRDIPIYNYIANWVYPNVKKSISKYIRDCYYYNATMAHTILNSEYIYSIDIQEAKYFLDKYSRILQILGYDNIKTPLDDRYISLYSWKANLQVIEENPIDIEHIYKLDQIRQEHNYYSMLTNCQTYEISFELLKLTRKLSRLKRQEKDEE